jgi:hypothetical protein
MLINKLKIMFFTALCFIFISCTVDVNQPVTVEENYVINAKDMFDSLVNHIGWRTRHTRLMMRAPTDAATSVELALVSVWQWTDNAILDDLKGNFTFNVYIQEGQAAEINDATLSHDHRTGREKRLYYSKGTWAIQSVGGPLNYVYAIIDGGSWNADDFKFNSLEPYFSSGEITVFGSHLSLLSASYTLVPIEEKERIINMTHVDHD